MKIVGIHQPNYIPWIGYFYKILKSDVFVILDNVDFQSGNASSVTNRCKVLGPNGIIQLTVPLKHNSDSRLICHQLIDQHQNWNVKHMRTIRSCYAKTPYFGMYYPQFEACWSQLHENLSVLNTGLIKLICQFLDISTPIVLASGLPLDNAKKTERIVNICHELKADTYLSGNGARKYNDPVMFEEHGIILTYSDFVAFQYPQQLRVFTPGLSILDALFQVGPELKNLMK